MTTYSSSAAIQAAIAEGKFTDPNWRAAMELAAGGAKQAEKRKGVMIWAIVWTVLVLALLIIISATTGQTARNVTTLINQKDISVDNTTV